MKRLFPLIFILLPKSLLADDIPNVLGIWTCSQKDCRVEVYKKGTHFEAKLIWSRKELDGNGNPKLDLKNPDPVKRNLPVIGSKTLWNASYNPTSGYFEDAIAYRNGRYFCGKFKLNSDGTLTVIGYNCSLRFLKFSETWTRIK